MTFFLLVDSIDIGFGSFNASKVVDASKTLYESKTEKVAAKERVDFVNITKNGNPQVLACVVWGGSMQRRIFHRAGASSRRDEADFLLARFSSKRLPGLA